jgi:hypothetical protein
MAILYRQGAAIVAVTLALMATTAAPVAANDAMEQAASACEDMIELIGDGDAKAAREKIATLKAAVAKIDTKLDKASRATLTQQIAAIESADKAGNGEAQSLAAVEAFRAIVAAPGRKADPLSVRIALHDYAGFKLAILARNPSPAWDVVAATARDTQENWTRLAPSVKSKGVTDLVTTINKGLQQSVSLKDRNGLAFAAQLTLDVVDVIEQTVAGP